MKRNVNNVKVVRGAEIGSDHHLVLMKVRLHRRVHARKVEECSRLSTERLATKEGKMTYRIRLRLKLNGAKWVNGSDVEKSWQEFRSEVMETAGVWGRKKCRNDKQRTRWWNKEVETAVRKKIAYKRWLQVKTREAKDEYLILKRAAGHEVRKAKND